MSAILVSLGITLAVYQLIITIRVATAAEYTTFQKVAQVLFIWLVPFVGAVACHIFLASDRQRHRPSSTTFTPDGGVNPPGIGSDGGHT